MASKTDTTPQKFDMRQSEEMWGNFLKLSKWLIALTVISLILMAVFIV